MQDAKHFLEKYVQRYHQEVGKDYFIYYAFQYEFCLNAKNSKRYVVIEPWSSQEQREDEDFSATLRKMYAWYREHYPAFGAEQPLTFAHCYFYLPAALGFVQEARQLWEKLHDAPPPVYDGEHDFWQALLSVVRERHRLLSAWLHWRYSERQAPKIATENLPPNPFVERRTFAPRRGRERREGMATRRTGTRERQPRRSSAPRRNDRPQERRRAAPSRRPRAREDRMVTELTDGMTSEIEAAVATMQRDRATQGVTLQPANSYYRRLQHKMVAKLGFTSISVGDSRDNRAVRIVRDA